jgi:hypothetical protein
MVDSIAECPDAFARKPAWLIMGASSAHKRSSSGGLIHGLRADSAGGDELLDVFFSMRGAEKTRNSAGGPENPLRHHRHRKIKSTIVPSNIP